MLWLLFTACCPTTDPVWSPLDDVFLDGASATVDLASLASDRGLLLFTAEGDKNSVITEVSDEGVLTVTPQPDFQGATIVTLTATDACDNASSTELVVFSGSEAVASSCATTLRYTGPASVAGTFNDWQIGVDPLEEQEDGTWAITLDLPPGDYPYKFVVDDGFGGTQWTCDPNQDWILCDAGYKSPTDTSWTHTCAPGVTSCNSLLRVENCAQPTITVTRLDIDRDANTLTVQASVENGDVLSATLDGEPVDLIEQAAFSGTLSELDEGRHELILRADGVTTEIPFWTDEREWEDGLVYFAFVDRLHNGDEDNDGSEGATALGGDFLGGDIAGLTEMLPYLDDLGVTILWLSNMQNNASDDWAGDCDATYAGYHAYWPSSPYDVEEHFGTDEALHTLIDAAHDRGMRVIMDWVANHVHDQHPYVTEHPEWFNTYAFCKDYVDGQINFDRIPETCWFAPYLPDIDYSHPEAMTTMVDDALWWAETYDLDGFRVDAVKHMPHAVSWNLNTALDQRLLHRSAGGTERFWTIGETFDGNPDLIAAYVDDNQLDGQFDFPLYFTIRATLIDDSLPLESLFQTLDASRATYGGAPMSTFLGNHDVLRFTTDAGEWSGDVCVDGSLRQASPPQDTWPYDRMKLGWTFLMTNPGIPLIYYGDEFGLPGYGDPDNRQPLWYYADLDEVKSVADLATQLSTPQQSVLWHVRTLAETRQNHPALRRGTRTEWWKEDSVYAYAQTTGTDEALVILNRSESPRTLTNAVAFAGLSEGTWTDALTGQTFTTDGDRLTVEVAGRGSRVLVRQ